MFCHGRASQLLAVAILTFTVACASSPTAPSPTSVTGPNGQTTDQSSSSTQDAPATSASVGATRFLAVGDSITFGTLSSFDVPAAVVCTHATPPSYAYPNVLQGSLNSVHAPQFFTVENCGIPGEGTGGGLSRLHELLSQIRPQGLLLLEGINDLNNGASVGHIVGNLQTMVEIARVHNVTVFVANMYQTHESTSPEPENRYRENSWQRIPEFNGAIAQMVSGRQNVYLVDLYHAFNGPGYVGNDGLHPTQAGFERMALWFRATIEQAFAIRAGFQ